MQLRGDELVVRRFPCFKCTIGVLCDDCRNAPGIRDVGTSEAVEEEVVEEEEEVEEEDIDDVGNSDDELSSEDDESDEEDEDEGDEIVWAPFG